MSNNDKIDKWIDDTLKKTARNPESSHLFRKLVMEEIQDKNERWLQTVKNFLFRPRIIKWNMAAGFASTALLLIVFFVYEAIGIQDGLPFRNASSSDIVHVRFMYQSDVAKHIALSGNFTQWRPTYSLQQITPGVWQISVPLKPGRYEYQFIIDGERRFADPNALQYQDDGFGGKNSIVIVGDIARQGDSSRAI